MSKYEKYSASLDSISQETLVLTANRRLTRFFEARLTAERANLNLKAWSGLQVLSLTGWVHQQWQDVQSNQLHKYSNCALLNDIQEKVLWQKIFLEHNQGFELLNETDTAELARKAWQTLRLWKVPIDSLMEYSETLFLKKLVNEFQLFCSKHKLIDEPLLTEIVVESHLNGVLSLPGKILLYGFQELPPLLNELMDYWQRQGSEIKELDFGCDQANLTIQACLNEEDEIVGAAKWAASILESSPEHKHKDLQIGIVVPDLTRLRPQVERIFTKIFEPQTIFAHQQRRSPGFNISAATPLIQTPVIAAAFYALELNKPEIDQQTLSHILLSPFIGKLQDVNARAQLAKQIQLLGPKIRRSKLFTLCAELSEESKKNGLRDFYAALKSFQKQARNSESLKMTPHDWAGIFHSQLVALGWPGTRQLNTLEYQQLQKWPEVLEKFSALDLALIDKINFSEALYYLRQCASHPFHAQTLSSPVQILGLLEAAGLQFDQLRILQMDDQHWPMPTEPNPFIPFFQQVEYSMPKSSALNELEYATRLTEKLSRSAQDVIFSYATHMEDREQQVSPLLQSIAYANENFLLSSPDYVEIIARDKNKVQAFVDICGPKVNNIDQIKGGTQILKDQAACYFQAFAKHRLGVKANDVYQAGINPRERGILIHQSLDTLWRQLKDQAGLNSLSQEALHKLVTQAVSQSWVSIIRDRELGKNLIAIESQRTVALLIEWLNLEKQRQPFKVIHQEKSSTLKIANLPLNVRYDRLDQLEDGSHFVIDYKTSTRDIQAWSGDRPDEPQIPIYALANEQKLSAAAFAIINSSQVEFKGITKNSPHTPGLKTPDELEKIDLPTNWEEIFQHWHTTLESLASAFIEGKAEVNPKKPAQTCRYCGLQSLCRVKENILTDEENNDLA